MIYSEVAAFAGTDNAIYVNKWALSNLVLRSFVSTLSSLSGTSTALAARPFAVRFNGASGMTAPGGNPAVYLRPDGADAALTSNDVIRLQFSLGLIQANQFGNVLTEFTLEMQQLSFRITANPDQITCASGDATVPPTAIQRTANFDTILTSNGLDRDLVTRLEGMLAFGALSAILQKTISQSTAIDLKQLFPGVSLVGGTRLGFSSDGSTLFIRGAAGTQLKSGTPCCSECLDGVGPVIPGTIVPAPNPSPNTPAGTITLGGPSQIAQTSLPALLGRRRRGEGLVGLFVSNSNAKHLVEGPFPGFRVDLVDNGFIGWRVTGFVDFNGFQFTPDPAMGRFFVDLDFRAEVYGNVQVDLGKLGKIRVTDFNAMQSGPASNHIRIGCYVVIGTKGIYIKPVIEQVNIGSYTVHLNVGTLIGTPFGAWGSVVGFIFDNILSRLIAADLPVRLDLEIRRYLESVVFTILSDKYAAEISGYSPATALRMIALYNGGPEGLLISCGDE